MILHCVTNHPQLVLELLDTDQQPTVVTDRYHLHHNPAPRRPHPINDPLLPLLLGE